MCDDGSEPWRRSQKPMSKDLFRQLITANVLLENGIIHIEIRVDEKGR